MNRNGDILMREAQFYKKEGEDIRCQLCPHTCSIVEGNKGICRQRRNKDGILVVEGYGNISSMALDPIEKKPLYHFYPGTNILSIGGLGCNLNCKFCQNWQIAHEDRATRYMAPEQIVDKAIELNSIGIAYTYNEPLIGYEYVYDTARLAREQGLKNVLVTNGFINREPLEKLLPYIDAMNIDVKAFNDDFYKNICAGSLSPVKDVVKLSAAACHVEITTLIVGSLNDSPHEMTSLASWLSSIDDDIPLHISRYYPNYQMNIWATPRATILKLSDIAKEYLNFVYIGNLIGVDNNTYCPKCKNLLIERGYGVRLVGIQEGKCGKCGSKVDKIA